MRNATPSLALMLLATVCAATAGCSGGEAAYADHARELEASPRQAAPNEPFRLHGEGFYGDFICDDNGPAFLSRPAGGRPTDGIQVEFVQGTRTWTLAMVASDKDLTFDAEGLEVPADAAPGEAIVKATSPSASRSMSPPHDEAPFLVLDDPETAGPGAVPARNEG